MASRKSITIPAQNDRAFPVRIFIKVPSNGFGSLDDLLVAWLNAQFGRNQWAMHSGGAGRGHDRRAVYLRDPEQAVRFLRAFPQLELSDDAGERPETPPLKPH